VAGCCEEGNEISGSMGGGGDFLTVNFSKGTKYRKSNRRDVVK
jgi:hypothetical protein